MHASEPDRDETPILGESRFANRELSWLAFDHRVLSLAEDTRMELLERVKFLAIAARNLDEFFQVRVALLNAEYESPVDVVSVDGLTMDEQLEAIRGEVIRLVAREDRIFEEQLHPALDHAGILLRRWEDLEPSEQAELGEIFESRIFPVLTPLAVDPTHPFPYVSNLSFNLAVLVRDPSDESVHFARIKVPALMERFLRLADGCTFVPIEDVIAAHLDRLFPGMEIQSHCPFRVTRDADLDYDEDDADDLLVALESSLHRRRRLSDAVRLEIHESMSDEARGLLLEELELDDEDVYVRSTLLDFGSLWELYQIDLPELKDSPWVPRTPPDFLPDAATDEVDLFAVLRERDVLVQHPYDSFDHSVEAFLAQAAADPQVLTIKHTLYRSSGPENPIGRTLIKAAQAGKQVVTLVELKARFDEETNIEWARALEQAGVHVVYGIAGLKTHGKVILVVRREGETIRRYCHVGTGNYNPVTARLYEDVGLFTASEEIGADLGQLFNHLTGYGRPDAYRKLLVAPDGLRARLQELILEESRHADGHVVLKINNLSDPAIIDSLYEASQRGAKIDCIVRGICCLRPGVPGLSENIRVRSVLGRFLEHSRLFRFGSGRRGFRYYLGSADLMSRNLDRRVEVVTPLESEEQRNRIDEVFAALMADDAGAWELRDQSWKPVDSGRGQRAQKILQRSARQRARA